MRRFIVLFVFLFVLWPSLAAAQSAPTQGQGIGASFFPQPTTLHYYGDIPNAEFDCISSFVCDGNGDAVDTLFHTDSADDMHRQAGWGETAAHWFVGQHKHTSFQFLVSKYDTAVDPTTQLPYVQWAYQDFVVTIKKTLQFKPYKAAADFSPIPDGATGESTTLVLHPTKHFVIAVAAYTADGTEIEALVFGLATGGREAKAWKWFQKEVAAALLVTP